MYVYHMYICVYLCICTYVCILCVYFAFGWVLCMYIGECTSVADEDTMSSLSLAQQMLINNSCKLGMCFNEQSETCHS